MITSAGAAKGHFDGALDEVRVWDHALTGAEIRSSINAELTSGTGLVARWGMGEGSGTAVGDSIAPAANGTITGSGYSWPAGAPFNISVTPSDPPNAPSLNAPADGATGISTSPTLSVTASDPDGGDLDVDFYGREAGGAAGPTFTLVTLPDTQNYTTSDTAAGLFNAQTQWIVDQKTAMNIVFAAHLGDITQNGDVSAEWTRANTAMTKLDIAGVPYSVTVGNHDGPLAYTSFLSTFPASRYASRGWYGGYLGDLTDRDAFGELIDDFGQDRGNLDSYQLFSAAGMDFIVLNLEVDSPAAYRVADWANRVLAGFPNRRAIVVTHQFLTTGNTRATSPYAGTGGISAETLWQTVIQPRCNVFMVLNGHAPGEGRRVDNNACGKPVHQILQDYQNYSNGGNGWLRYYEFDPSNDQIHASTYSPVTGGYETDESSQFTLTYDMVGGSPFQLLGSDTVASGGTASFTWSGLTADKTYEWYAVASDATDSATSPVWSFTAGASVPTYPTVPVSAGSGEKPQSKVWEHAGSWWAVMPSTTASPRAPGSGARTSMRAGAAVLKLSAARTPRPTSRSSATSRTCCCTTPHRRSSRSSTSPAATGMPSGRHARRRPASPCPTARPRPSTSTRPAACGWRPRPARPSTSTTATLRTPRSAARSTLATGINSDDISVVTAMPNNTIGVLWSNQNTQRFGFQTHADGADPATWSADEVPGLRIRSGRRTRHGRRPSQRRRRRGRHALRGRQDELRHMPAIRRSRCSCGDRTAHGTRCMRSMSPAPAASSCSTSSIETVRVVYTSTEGYNDIVVKTSPTSSISFGARQTVMSGGLNDVTSTKSNWTDRSSSSLRAPARHRRAFLTAGTPPAPATSAASG